MMFGLSEEDELLDKLRAEVEGVCPSEAALELVVRSRLLHRLEPFIAVDPDGLYAAIDWDAFARELITGKLGFSGGERRLLSIAASLGAGGYPVDLRDVSDLDARHSVLVVQALAHACGREEERIPVAMDGSFVPLVPVGIF
jgi:hypothetical protein